MEATATVFSKKKKRKSQELRSRISSRHLFWLAGVLEGEGSFCSGPPSNPNTPGIHVQMTDEDVVCRVADMFGTKSVYICKVAKSHYKPTYTAVVRGGAACELMRQLRPLMSIRRKSQIDKALASYNPNLTYAKAVAQRKLDDKEVEKIKNRYKNGESLRTIAKDYGVHHETIRLRIRGGQPYSCRKDWKYEFEEDSVAW